MFQNLIRRLFGIIFHIIHICRFIRINKCNVYGAFWIKIRIDHKFIDRSFHYFCPPSFQHDRIQLYQVIGCIKMLINIDLRHIFIFCFIAITLFSIFSASSIVSLHSQNPRFPFLKNSLKVIAFPPVLLISSFNPPQSFVHLTLYRFSSKGYSIFWDSYSFHSHGCFFWPFGVKFFTHYWFCSFCFNIISVHSYRNFLIPLISIFELSNSILVPWRLSWSITLPTTSIIVK